MSITYSSITEKYNLINQQTIVKCPCRNDVAGAKHKCLINNLLISLITLLLLMLFGMFIEESNVLIHIFIFYIPLKTVIHGKNMNVTDFSQSAVNKRIIKVNLSELIVVSYLNEGKHMNERHAFALSFTHIYTQINDSSNWLQ